MTTETEKEVRGNVIRRTLKGRDVWGSQTPGIRAEQEQKKMKQQKEYEGMFCCYFFCSEHDIFVSTLKTMNLRASVSNVGQITVIVTDLE